MRFCLNRWVLAGLVLAALALWALAPNLVAAALPLLILAACPLSMLLMMKGVGKHRCASEPRERDGRVQEPRSRAEQIAELRRQLTQAEAQRARIAHQLAELEAVEGQARPPVPRSSAITTQAGEGKSQG